MTKQKLSEEIRAAYTFIPSSVAVTSGEPAEYGPAIPVLTYGGVAVETVVAWKQRAEELEQRVARAERVLASLSTGVDELGWVAVGEEAARWKLTVSETADAIRHIVSGDGTWATFFDKEQRVGSEPNDGPQ